MTCGATMTFAKDRFSITCPARGTCPRRVAGRHVAHGDSIENFSAMNKTVMLSSSSNPTSETLPTAL